MLLAYLCIPGNNNNGVMEAESAKILPVAFGALSWVQTIEPLLVMLGDD